MKAFFFIFTFICNCIYAEKFILMTTLYNEQRETRYSEFLTCLDKNTENEFIKRIIILYEGNLGDFFYKKLADVAFLNDKIAIQIIESRPSFAEFFYIANCSYKNEKIIISNADIYFDNTIDLLTTRYLEGKFIALTRWDLDVNGQYRLKDRELPSTPSQDSWFFLSPIRDFFADIQIGILGCDPSIAYYAFKAGLKVLNPSKAVCSYHVHTSNIRTYIDYDLQKYDNIHPFLFLKQIGLSKNRRV